MAATITGIALSNTQLSGTAASGTEIGTITVTLSDGSSFDGALTLSGPYASYFTITATRDPYAISAVTLDNYTLPANSDVGTKVGTLTVTMSDGSVFSGTLTVDDTTHFKVNGFDLVTNALLAQTIGDEMVNPQFSEDGSSSTWMMCYPFGGSEYTLSYNNEKQYFGSPTRTPGFNPFSVSNGILTITADTVAHTVSNPLGLPYNSGAITSAGKSYGMPVQGMYTVLYGRIAARMLLPKGKGLWPALWLEPVDPANQPSCEVDIMEAHGGDPLNIYCTIHGTTNSQTVVPVSDFTTNWHEYALDWQQDYTRWLVDGAEVKRVATPADFKAPQYILINLAVGGSWFGDPDGTTPFPAKMLIDYVRITPAGAQAGGTFPITITAADASATNKTLSASFQVSAQTTAQVPGPLTSIASPYQDTSSIQVTWAAPTAGGACDAGVHQIQYKAASSQTWLNAPTVRYCTPSHGSFTDAFGNAWSVDANNHPVVNGAADTYSNLTILYLVGGTIWQLDLSGTWWGTTPAGTISGNPSWFSGGTTSPLSVTISGLSAGAAYNVRGYASNAAGNGTASAAANFSTQAASPPGSVGPPATSTFMQIEFQSARNYTGKSTQQIISQRMYGVGTSSLGNTSFAAMADATVQSTMAQVNPGLFMFNHMDPPYWNADRSINAATLANLVNNFYKMDPLGISGVMFSINWDYIPGGNGNAQLYGDGMKNLATYLNNYTMPNGKKFPVIGFIGWDEPDGQNEDTVASYYNDMIPKIKAVNSNFLIAGPQGSSCYWTDFGSKVPSMDVFSYNAFPEGCLTGGAAIPWNDLNGAIASRMGRWTGDAQAAASASGPNLNAVMCAGIGMEWDCVADAMYSYVGAIWLAVVQIAQLNGAVLPTWPCVWGGWGNGTCGMVTDTRTGYYGHDGTMRITPKGYYAAEGVRKVYGPRWNVTGNFGGMSVCATTPTSSKFGITVANYGQGDQVGPVALSHWPVNGTGTGPVRCWQMTSSVSGPGTDGTVATLQATNGVIPSVRFPNGSVTVLSA